MEENYFQPATLLKVTLLHGCFSRFLNCTNGTKSHKASHMINVTRTFDIASLIAGVTKMLPLYQNVYVFGALVLRRVYKINIVCLSVSKSGIFSGMGHQFFLFFLLVGRQWEYLKTDRALLSRKIHFCPNLGTKCPKWPLKQFPDFLKNFLVSFSQK